MSDHLDRLVALHEAQLVSLGEHRAQVCGGMENFSRAPQRAEDARAGSRTPWRSRADGHADARVAMSARRAVARHPAGMRRFALVGLAVLFAVSLAGCGGADRAPICDALQANDDPSALINTIQANSVGKDYPTALITAERETRETCPDQVYKVDRVRELVGA